MSLVIQTEQLSKKKKQAKVPSRRAIIYAFPRAPDRATSFINTRDMTPEAISRISSITSPILVAIVEKKRSTFKCSVLVHHFSHPFV